MFEIKKQNHCNLWFDLWFKSYKIQSLWQLPSYSTSMPSLSHIILYSLIYTLFYLSTLIYLRFRTGHDVCIPVGSCCSRNFFVLFISPLFLFPLMRDQMRTLGGCESSGADWKCVCVRNLTLRVGGGWWPLTLQHCVCVWWPWPLRRLSPGLNLTLNRTSTVFHCGAFPHASVSMYDSLSNQREGDASVSDLIEPWCPRSAFQMLPLLKKQN